MNDEIDESLKEASALLYGIWTDLTILAEAGKTDELIKELASHEKFVVAYIMLSLALLTESPSPNMLYCFKQAINNYMSDIAARKLSLDNPDIQGIGSYILAFATREKNIHMIETVLALPSTRLINQSNLTTLRDLCKQIKNIPDLAHNPDLKRLEKACDDYTSTPPTLTRGPSL